ncbi:Ppx/GppA phosphatase family protein [Actinomadura rupiterrae]|uniref:Ppx/GppA phosphatase family protein n=1 Tax=Actinomadura rupiterrae TaxID=559627 RepID=UPI0020A55A40|nr:Ppx/GppA family phosphatase [Actinomadura rupiterrae]MCP2342836.1 exopolyphosphatase/guanosine-5'-triphosphate,3'-diphosphate pyrophosphatase [Actinomadura rupiterrae]
MRIAVLDVGSNSAHLQIADLEPDGTIRDVASAKHPTRLAERTGPGGRIDAAAVERLVRSVGTAHRIALEHGAAEMIAFATSAIREADGDDAIARRVADRTGIRLDSLPGRDEARLTFLAARAWFGRSAGPLLLADIGGGSLEIAAGDGTESAVEVSVPLGAGRLTREHLSGDPPEPERVERLAEHIRTVFDEKVRPELPLDEIAGPRFELRAVATSKTFKQLAKLTGGRDRQGRRVLKRKRLRKRIPRLAKLPAGERARLKGVSASRAEQILAGAMVAEAFMTAFDVKRLELCPWAVREGIALRRLQQVSATLGLRYDIDRLVQPLEAPELDAPARLLGA